MDGPQVALLNIPSFHAARDDAEAEALLARWSAMPAYLDTAVDALRRGAAEGRVGVAALCAKVIEQIDDVLAHAGRRVVARAHPAEDRPELREPILAAHPRCDPPRVRALSSRRGRRDRAAGARRRPAGTPAHPGRGRRVRRPGARPHLARHAARGGPRHRPRRDRADRRRVRRARPAAARHRRARRHAAPPCATIRRSTSRPARRSSASPRPRWRAPPRPSPHGSAACRRRRARSW